MGLNRERKGDNRNFSLGTVLMKSEDELERRTVCEDALYFRNVI